MLPHAKCFDVLKVAELDLFRGKCPRARVRTGLETSIFRRNLKDLDAFRYPMVLYGYVFVFEMV
jgi:hypothetical protein